MNHNISMAIIGLVISFAKNEYRWACDSLLLGNETSFGDGVVGGSGNSKRNIGTVCFLFDTLRFLILHEVVWANVIAGAVAAILWPWGEGPENWERRCQSHAWYGGAARLTLDLLAHDPANVNKCPDGLNHCWLGTECSLQQPPVPSVYSRISRPVVDPISSFW